MVMFGNGSDAAAAVAMAIPTGNGQIVSHGDPAGIRVFDFNEELVQTDAAVKLHPLVGFLQCADSLKCIFQTVGQQ